MHNHLTKRVRCLIALAIFIFAAWAQTPAAAAAAAPEGFLAFILDGSGSMWGRVQGGTKIGVGKAVMADLVRDIPDGMNVVLVVYGHRRTGDCADVEALFPLGPIDRDKFIEKINSVSPRGKTPIALAIKTTFEKLRGVGEEVTITLISDGKETCKGDPCALVRDLKQSGLKFVLHVIGLDVGGEARKQLECIAEAGGGNFSLAQNTRAFMLAGKKVVEDPKFATGRLMVSTLKDGRPFSAYVRVFRSGGKDQIARSYAYPPNPASFNLLPGKYDVRVEDNDIPQEPFVTLKAVELKAGESVKKTAELPAEGFLRVETLHDGEPVSAGYSVFSPADGHHIAGGYSYEPSPVKLLPGVYNVSVKSKDGKFKKEIKGVSVTSGRTETVRVVF